MSIKKLSRILQIAAIGLLLIGNHSSASEVRVAVASNFTHVLDTLGKQFEAQTGNKITLIVGSTGQHYAQIKHGAPFDVFFAADISRPALLEAEGLALPGTRFTYATGKLVLWRPNGEAPESTEAFLQRGDFRFLAVANPQLAPYGKAALEVLQSEGLWQAMRGRMVQGQNIAQTYQFVKSQSAELGFVAYSQLKMTEGNVHGTYWTIPQSLYTPIRQQAVLLRENPAARAFWQFVQSREARKIIRDYGYETPDTLAESGALNLVKG